MADVSYEEALKIIEDLAFKTMSTEPDDVGGLGELLSELERVGDSEGLPSPLVSVVAGLNQGIETLIMSQSDDPRGLMDCILEGVALLQEHAKGETGEAGLENILNPYFQKLSSLGVSVSVGKQEPEAISEEAQKAAEAKARESTQEVNVIVDAETCYEFIAETLGNFDEAETTLVELEEDPGNKEFINAIFRFFHTAKGVSGFLNLKRMNHFAHELENLLDELRNGRLQFTHAIIDFIFKAMDFMKSMLGEVKASLDGGVLEEPTYDVESIIRQTASILSKGNGDDTSQGTKAEPLGDILVDMGKVSADDVNEALAQQKQTGAGEKIGDILVRSGKIGDADVNEALNRQSSSSQDKASNVRVSTSKLDNVVDLVGELVIAESLVFQNPLIQAINDQKLFKDFSQMHRITSELQKTAMSMRMVPIRQTFQKMVRLVRDLAQKSGKGVNLVMSGEETEIDRHMVDEIYDPLVHMIRNSADHGLEPPDERTAAGKDPKGTITLRAYHQGGHLLIEIRDDGRGLNREKIYSKALEKKIINANESYTDRDVYNFIFLPGFSTADKVTDISGRGVGMDVVKKFIDKIRGSVEIDSRPGQGTIFTIKLPLTLAIIDGILVTVGRERYIIPTMAVKESIQPNEKDLFTVTGKGEVIKIRGRILPLVRLHHILDIKPSAFRPSQGIVVVLEHEDQEFGLLIDKLVGKQEVVIKSLGGKLKDTKAFSGGAILGDGRVGLILDVKGMLELYFETGSMAYQQEESQPETDDDVQCADAATGVLIAEAEAAMPGM